jgi:hypothetical protein
MGEDHNHNADTKAFIAKTVERLTVLSGEGRPSPRQSLARESIAEQDYHSGMDLAFSARMLVQATLPHSKPAPDQLEYARTNGKLTLSVHARKRFGLPYGTYPRLLLTWMTTEAVRTKSPSLTLGASLSEFMRKLDLAPTGGKNGTIKRLRDHMGRLFTSYVSAMVDTDSELSVRDIKPVTGFSLFWDPKNPDQGTLWNSNLQLTEEFFKEITSRPVPIDLRVLRALAKERSPLAIDIYQWLTHRMSYLKRPITVPWDSLQLQFGGNYSRTRAFKQKFNTQLKNVLDYYPEAKVEPAKGGLKLRPSPTHVRKRLGGR